MTGHELYSIYQKELLRQGCDSEPFDDLDPVERFVWNAVAAKLQMRPADDML